MKIIFLMILILTNVSLKAQNRKDVKDKVKKDFFKNTKGGQYFSGTLYPGFRLYEDRKYVELGISLGYGFFPVNNWSMENCISYARIHNISSYGKKLKNNDGNTFTFSVTNTYHMFSKKRFNLLIGLDVILYVYSYQPNKLNESYLFYKDDYDGRVHTHIIPALAPFVGFSVKISRHFSINYRLGYRHNFHPNNYRLDSPLKPFYFNHGINYNFMSLKRPKENKEIKF